MLLYCLFSWKGNILHGVPWFLPSLGRLATFVVTSFHFSPSMPGRHQPLEPGSPQSPEHLESVRFFSSGSGLGLIPFTAQHGFSGQKL